jgi:hypothetical protein
MSIKQIFIIVFCLCNIVLNSQITVPAKTNELDEQYTPKGSGPLSADSKTSKSGSSGSNYDGDYPKNIAKFAPTLLSRGIFAINYERNFADNFSLVGGLGFNYNKDLIFSLLGSGFDLSDNYNQGQVQSSDVLSASTHDSPSLYFNFAPKFIFENYWNDGYSYLQIDYSHYANKMNFETDKTSNSSNYQYIINGSPSIKYSHNIYALKYGYQYNTDTKLVTSHEFWISLGYRSYKYTPVYMTETSNSSYPYNTTREYSVSKTGVIKQSFYVGFGYSFGIGFNK